MTPCNHHLQGHGLSTLIPVKATNTLSFLVYAKDKISRSLGLRETRQFNDQARGEEIKLYPVSARTVVLDDIPEQENIFDVNVAYEASSFGFST